MTSGKQAALSAIFLTLLMAFVAYEFGPFARKVEKQEDVKMQTKTYVFVKQGCQHKILSKEESELWGTYSQDKVWVFLAPSVCEGTYTLMSSEGLETVGTVSFVDGGIIIELDKLRIGIK